MPQLDILIILPQIFWLILSFSFFYFFLSYFFLPLFLKTINSRKKFLKTNQIIETQLISNSLKKRQFILKKLNLTFSKIRSIIFLNIFSLNFNFYQQPFEFAYIKLTNQLLIATMKSILFCNTILLKSLKFYPFVLNKLKK
uniref:ATP synthase F0 subunit 8 n=1 Tax=Melanothamnus gigas TaxID=3016206 RepID=A0A9F1U5B6_9FLOR|nr:ATP synthase F0 subunit 8 [Melanothamnus gigas]WAX04174.1 ATP synthase F0 subunit 8 [Melanothamnus gigas]